MTDPQPTAARQGDDPADNLASLAPSHGALEHLTALRRAHADATSFYIGCLHAPTLAAATAREVLAHRGVSADAVAAYQLGLAPSSWTALVDHLRGRGYDQAQLLGAGLALRSRRGTLVDRFRDRLMIPVHQPDGRHVVGFLGRALHPDDRTPKYLNSPETALYRKSDLLYGLGAVPVLSALAAGARPVLVEGAFDAVAVTCASRGRYAGVAPSGTALTDGHIAALASAVRLSQREVVVTFDADAAGRAGALRCFAPLRARGYWPTATRLPEGEDPASLMQTSGAAALLEKLDAAQPLVDLVVDDRIADFAETLQWAEGRVGATRSAAAVIAGLPPERVGPQIARVAAAVGVDVGSVLEEVLACAGASTPAEHEADQPRLAVGLWRTALEQPARRLPVSAALSRKAPPPLAGPHAHQR